MGKRKRSEAAKGKVPTTSGPAARAGAKLARVGHGRPAPVMLREEEDGRAARPSASMVTAGDAGGDDDDGEDVGLDLGFHREADGGGGGKGQRLSKGGKGVPAAPKLSNRQRRKMRELAELQEKKKRRAYLYAEVAQGALASNAQQLLVSSTRLSRVSGGASASSSTGILGGTKRERLREVLLRERAGLKAVDAVDKAGQRELYRMGTVAGGGDWEEDGEAGALALAAADRAVENDLARRGVNGNSRSLEGTQPDVSGEGSVAPGSTQGDKTLDGEGRPPGPMTLAERIAAATGALVLQGQSRRDGEVEESAPQKSAFGTGVASIWHLGAPRDPNAFHATDLIYTLDSDEEGEGEGAPAKPRVLLPGELEAEHEAAEQVGHGIEGLEGAATMRPEDIANAPTLRKKVVIFKRSEDMQSEREKLPVVGSELEIMEAVGRKDFVIVSAETGSGKTTQVPQFLAEAGFGRVVVTQPRRVAATSSAQRVHAELGPDAGRLGGRWIGYHVRHDAKASDDTCILFVTDGLLLREARSDPLLSRYDAVVVDEAHERNVNSDILLGLLSRISPLRRRLHEAKAEGSPGPLKVIIMSATLRATDFVRNSRLFPQGPPPVVRVDAKMYPVTYHFSKRTELRDYIGEAASKVCKIHRRLPAGGVLVFVTGRREVEYLCNHLEEALTPKQRGGMKGKGRHKAEGENTPVASVDGEWDAGPIGIEEAESDGDGDKDDSIAEMRLSNDLEFTQEEKEQRPVLILPMYSMLSSQQQAKVFEPVPEGTRLIVVATNVAETSITIPGIRYVVDTGRSKERWHHTSSGLSGLSVGWISKSSAKQRAGRAGRTGPGHVYCLYSSAVYERQFAKHPIPEVLRSPLDGVVLSLKAFGVDRVVRFPFPTAPTSARLRGALRVLVALGALSGKGVQEILNPVSVAKTKLDDVGLRITARGMALSAYPLPPRHAQVLHWVIQRCVENIMATHVRSPGRKSSGQAEARKQSLLLLYRACCVVAAMGVHDPFLSGPVAGISKVIVPTAPPPNPAGLAQKNGDNALHSKADDVSENEHQRFRRDNSDLVSAAVALAAYEHAVEGGASPREQFCELNRLHAKAMREMSLLRKQFFGLSVASLSSSLIERSKSQDCANAQDVMAAAEKVMSEGSSAKRPMTKSSESLNWGDEALLRRAILNGLPDCLARKAPAGYVAALREAKARAIQEGEESNKQDAELRHIAKGQGQPYLCHDVEGPVYLHPNSAVARTCPEFVVYSEVVARNERRTDEELEKEATANEAAVAREAEGDEGGEGADDDWGTASAAAKAADAGVRYLRGVTVVTAEWVGEDCRSLCRYGSAPMDTPSPCYVPRPVDRIECFVSCSYGRHLWELPPVRISMRELAEAGRDDGATSAKAEAAMHVRYRWFARALLEGGRHAPCPAMSQLSGLLADKPSVLTETSWKGDRGGGAWRATALCLALEKARVDSWASLRAEWASHPNFLRKELLLWLSSRGKQPKDAALDAAWPALLESAASPPP